MSPMTTLTPSPAQTRRAARDLLAGDVNCETGIRTGVVDQVTRDPDFRDGCLNVAMEDGRCLILHEYRGVRVEPRTVEAVW